MASRVNTEFKHEVVRAMLTSGLGRKQIASDFDIGFSTLGRWIKEERDHVFSAGPQDDLIKENERLYKWFLQSPSKTFSARMEKSIGFRKKSCLNKNKERN